MLFPIKVTQPTYSKPSVTVALILANILVFLHELSLDAYSLHHFMSLWGLEPRSFRLENIFSAMFIHAGWLHIGGNMLFLWVFGGAVEDILGHGKFLIFYLGCGVAAALAQVASDPVSAVPMVGASGAIAGVMGAYLVKFPRSRVEMLFFAIFFFRFEVAAWFMLIYWFAVQLLGGFGSSEASAGGTAFMAHVGGFASGILLIYLMGARERWASHRDLYW
ncbi:MAG TPA: rhomboid family intramembrane serine protease [Bryobacteraceae bacterium]|nr:rhomboid family intramembrane serine protease [Bryobacteraceae bacterium]